jgi:hypothetical protein
VPGNSGSTGHEGETDFRLWGGSDGEKAKNASRCDREGMRQRRRLCLLRPTILNFLENAFRIACGRSIYRLVLQNGVARDAHSG